ncbi:MAG: anti-sigma factor family protein [Caldicoprobacterales bacterium]|nr:hypothetical protein [Clostridiales bacterium]
MKKCKFKKLLEEYTDNRLDPPAAIQVENHLDHCCTCRQEVYELTVIKQIVRGLPEETPPTKLHDRIIYQVKNKIWQDNMLVRVRRGAVFFAIILLALLLSQNVTSKIPVKLLDESEIASLDHINEEAKSKESETVKNSSSNYDGYDTDRSTGHPLASIKDNVQNDADTQEIAKRAGKFVEEKYIIISIFIGTILMAIAFILRFWKRKK